MIIKLDLHNLMSRVAMPAAALFCGVILAGLALTQFITSALADPQTQVDPVVIESAVNFYPNSARMQARMAARLIESGLDESLDYEHTAERAVFHASRASKLAPWNYEIKILLAAAREMKGDLAGSEADLRAALALSSHHVNVRWRLANLLLRMGKLDQAIIEFRAVSESDPSRLRAALDLVRQASQGDLQAIEAVAGSNPNARLALAQYLLQQGQVDAAINVVNRLERQSLLGLPESGQFLDSIILAGRVESAGKLWRDLFSHGQDDGSPALIWNGSFETPIREGFPQFDWNLSGSRYARIAITAQTARIGRQSLRIAYQGQDTTKLDGEIRQLIPARPGARYRLTFYAKAENLVTPDGPQVVVAAYSTEKLIAASPTLDAGSYDWRPMTLNFVVPSDVRAVIVSVKQTPQYSYVDPTKGTVWLDDFVLTQQ
jgi:tetratricopeptide (TPR) repeat protein